VGRRSADRPAYLDAPDVPRWSPELRREVNAKVAESFRRHTHWSQRVSLRGSRRPRRWPRSHPGWRWDAGEDRVIVSDPWSPLRDPATLQLRCRTCDRCGFRVCFYETDPDNPLVAALLAHHARHAHGGTG
jgi:hypothetical protein